MQNIALLFNEYLNRLNNNIADCKIMALSIRLSKDELAYACAKKDGLAESDIRIIKSGIKNSDNEIELHRLIYNIKNADAVIHADAPNARAVALTGKTIPPLLDDLAQIIGVDAKCSEDDCGSIIKNLKKRKGTLIKNAGLITYGRTLDEAFAGCLVLEKGAKCFIDTAVLGKYSKIPYLEAKLMHFIYQKKYSKANQYLLKSLQSSTDTPQSQIINQEISAHEYNLRQSIVAAGKRLLQNNLVQGTWGNISIRLDDNYMLITPSGMDYMSLRPEDIVIANINTLEYKGTLKPSGEKGIHAALLRERTDINVVMHSHPSECSAFAAASYELPLINSDMEKFVKGSAKTAKYALPSTKGLAKATVKAIQGRNACFMANHGMLAVGKDIFDTFECCRILENAAKTFIEDIAEKASAKGNYNKRINLFLERYNS